MHTSSSSPAKVLWFVCNHRCFTLILLFCHWGNKAFNSWGLWIVSYSIDFLFCIVHLREEVGCFFLSGLQTGARFREAELKTVTETGNYFNRPGLPLFCAPTAGVTDYSKLPSMFVIRCRGLLPTVYFVLPVVYEGSCLVSYKRGGSDCECIEIAVNEEVKSCC